MFTDAELTLQRRPLLLVFPMLLVALMLRFSFASGFYSYDDMMYVYLADRMPVKALFSPRTGATPVTLLSFKFDRAIFGPRAETPRPLVETGELGTVLPPPEVAKAYREGIFGPASRIMNALYHLGAGILLWLFLTRIRVSAGVAMIVSLAWIGHPTACESVCWISERKNVLVALFGFATLYAWSAERQWRWRWPLVYVLFALALGSKQSGLGILPILVALEMTDPIQRSFNFRSAGSWMLLAKHMLVPALLAFGEVFINVIGWGTVIKSSPNCTLYVALLTDCEVFARYVMNAFLPVNLSFFYYIERIETLFDARVLLYGVPLLLVFVLSIIASKPSDRHLAVLGTIWFFGALAPNANLAFAYVWMQDRYLYLSLPGVLLAVCVGVRGLAGRFPASDKILLYIAASWMVLLTICLSIRASYFVDADTVELDAVERQPLSSQAQMMAGFVYRRLVFESSPEGSKPDATLVKPAAKKCCLHFQNAIHCPDHQHFVNPFRLTLTCAEVLMQAGEYQAVGNLLPSWLPPPDLVLFDHKTMSMDSQNSSYTPDMLAHGWILLSESLRRQSLSPALPEPERDALLNKALAAAEHSIALDNPLFEGTIVRAKILLQISANDAEKRDLAAADEHYQLAVSLLRSVPAGSPNEKVAKYVLDHATAPK